MQLTTTRVQPINEAKDPIERDEYGNYYKVVGLHMDGETLKALEVSNLYFELSFESSADSIGEGNGSKPVGVFLQERLNAYIEDIQQRERPIYGIRDLMVNRIKVYAVDITQPHPKRDMLV